MNDVLVRLDKATLRQMKRDARVAFAGPRHAHALEAMARGLGADSFNELRDYARDYGAILWDGNDAEAISFLQMRGSTVPPGRLAWLVEGHAIDHETVPGFDEWSRGSAAIPV